MVDFAGTGAADIARLGIEVDATQVEQARDALGRFTASAEKTGLAVTSLNQGLGLSAESHINAARAALTANVEFAGVGEAGTTVGFAARRAALQMDALTRSMGAVAAGGTAAAAGITGVSSALSYLTLSNPALFEIVTTLGLLWAGWEAVSKSIKGAKDEMEKFNGVNKVRLEAMLAEDQAKLAAGQQTVTQYDRFGEARGTTTRISESDQAKIIDHMTALRSAIQALDTATAHESRTEAEAAAQRAQTYLDSLARTADLFGKSEYEVKLYDLALHANTLTAEQYATALSDINRWFDQFTDHLVLQVGALGDDGDMMDTLIDRHLHLENALSATSAGMAAFKIATETGKQAMRDMNQEMSQAAQNAKKMLEELARAGDGVLGLGHVFNVTGNKTGGFSIGFDPIGAAVGAFGMLTTALGASSRALEEQRLALEQYTADLAQAKASAAGDTYQQFYLSEMDKQKQLQRAALSAAGLDPNASDAQVQDWLRNGVQVGGARIQNPWLGDQFKQIADVITQDLKNYQQQQADQAKQQQIGVLQQTLSALNSTVSALSGFRSGLSLNSQLSILSPAQQLQEAQRQYQQVVDAAKAGDQAAANQLPQAAQAFLTASRSYNASGLAYVADFNRVQADSAAVLKLFQDQKDTAQKQLDKLAGIEAKAGTMVNILTDLTTANATGLTALADRLDVIETTLQTQTSVLNRKLQSIAMLN